MKEDQCYWCGSRMTHFDHFECLEQDSLGDPIRVTSEEQASLLKVTICRAMFWCDVCEGYFGFSYSPGEDATGTAGGVF